MKIDDVEVVVGSKCQLCVFCLLNGETTLAKIEVGGYWRCALHANAVGPPPVEGSYVVDSIDASGRFVLRRLDAVTAEKKGTLR